MHVVLKHMLDACGPVLSPMGKGASRNTHMKGN